MTTTTTTKSVTIRPAYDDDYDENEEGRSLILAIGLVVVRRHKQLFFGRLYFLPVSSLAAAAAICHQLIRLLDLPRCSAVVLLAQKISKLH